MKITKSQLKQIIKKEYLKQNKILNEQLTPLETAFTKERDLLRLLNTLKDQLMMRSGTASKDTIQKINKLISSGGNVARTRYHDHILKSINAGFEYAVQSADGKALNFLNRAIETTKKQMNLINSQAGQAMIAKHKPGFDAAEKASRQFQQNLPKDAAAASARGGLMGALAAGGAGVMAVDAIDAMAGPELRKLIAMATGEDPGRIPTPSLKRRLKALASPVTGMVDLAEIGADKLSLALGMREPTQDEAGEEAWDERIAAAEEAEEQGFGRTFSPGSIRQAPRRIGRHKLPAGAMLGDPIREAKITKSQLNKIIKEELEDVLSEEYFDLEGFEKFNLGDLHAKFKRQKQDIERACKEQVEVLRKDYNAEVSKINAEIKAKHAGDESWSLPKWLRKQLGG
jgi:hypothetical protein